MPHTYQTFQYVYPICTEPQHWAYSYKKFLRHCGDKNFNEMVTHFKTNFPRTLSRKVIENMTAERNNFRYSYLDSWFIHFYLRYLPWHRWYSPEKPPYNPLLLHERFHKKVK